jgi:diguanylate cyclase (GGDEF)-like protein
VPPSPSLDFAPYAQLLKTLLPRVRGIYVYAPDGALLWTADGTDSHDLRPLAEELLEAAKRSPAGRDSAGRVCGDEPGYAFILRDDSGAVVGALGLVCRGASRDGDMPTHDSIGRSLAPLLLLARRELTHQRGTETGRFNVNDTQELEWLLEVNQLDAPADAGVDSLQTLLEAFTSRVRCDLTLLHVPGRRLERLATRGELTPSELDTLRGVVSRHLFRVAELQKKTLIVNKVREDGAGGAVPFRILCVPLLRRGRVLGVVVAFSRATSPAFGTREAQSLERLAPRLNEIIDVRFDGTTGLMTRHAFEEYAAGLSKESPGTERCLVYANLDELGSINELYGFEAGDSVLAAAGEAWRARELGDGSAMARLGSDKFVALLDRAGVESGRRWAEGTRLALAGIGLPTRLQGLKIAASFGVAPLRGEGSLEHALAAAERACNTAKARGGDRVEIHAALGSRTAEQEGEYQLHRELLDAFDVGRLRLFAQPIMPLWDPSLPVRYEILARMIDARGHAIPAERFIAIASRHQLLRRLDDWVLDDLLARLGPCERFLANNGVTFSVNVAAQSLLLPDRALAVKTALERARVNPSLLGFEINERTVVERFAETEKFIAGVADLGCRTAIDGFGTGATSLSYLKSLRVSALKIDGSFIRDMIDNPRSESLLRAILHIARQLEFQTVAEWVESKDTASHLAALGVTYGQGLALGEPQPLTEVLDALARRSAPRLTEAIAPTVGDAQVH